MPADRTGKVAENRSRKKSFIASLYNENNIKHRGFSQQNASPRLR